MLCTEHRSSLPSDRGGRCDGTAERKSNTLTITSVFSSSSPLYLLLPSSVLSSTRPFPFIPSYLLLLLFLSPLLLFPLLSSAPLLSPPLHPLLSSSFPPVSSPLHLFSSILYLLLSSPFLSSPPLPFWPSYYLLSSPLLFSLLFSSLLPFYTLLLSPPLFTSSSRPLPASVLLTFSSWSFLLSSLLHLLLPSPLLLSPLFTSPLLFCSPPPLCLLVALMAFRR